MRRVLVLLAGCLLLGTAGCSSSPRTGDKGYVGGEGVITRLAVADRDKPGAVSGTTLEGNKIALSSYAGKVVVVNVWGAWCPPCRAEATRLADAARELSGQDVVFVGINTRDASQDQGLAFQRRFTVPYPSIYDPSGRTLLAFRGTLTPTSIPSTVILDKQGRVAASVLGEVTSSTTLVDLVQDVAGG